MEPIIQGRRVRAEDLAQIQAWLAEHPAWHRTRLSRELCALWGWRNEAGRLKDLACRSLLLKLQARGWLGLPPRQRASVNGRRNRRAVELPHEATPLHAELAAWCPLSIAAIGSGSWELGLFQFFLRRHHYLGHRNGVGENLKYLVRERHGRPVACLLFGSAAWHSQPRDAFIGWSGQARQGHLRLLTNNIRFLILPWVRVPHLASHILRLISGRLSRDWQDKYGHPIHLLETFVERDRFAGAGYRAAGWIAVGATTGRGRNAPGRTPQGPVKEVYLQPLRADFRRRLGA